MNEIADPLIGLNITGTYVIRQKLAEGGMGAVYVAVNELGNKKVVKFLLPAAPQIRERFDREARAAARLRGRPHIVEIDDVGRLPNGMQFLTMEFLHGRPLDVHIHKTGRMSPHDAFLIILQIGWGLHELHEHGIVHRDLKPGNVFLQSDRDGQSFYVKLIDLGIAHDATLVENGGAQTITGAAMGTPGYMAPEQYTDAGSVTPSADVYALAIILCELLTGERPWTAPNPSMLFHLQQTQRPTIPFDVDMPEAWRDVMLAALALDPLARPQDVYTFLAPLASELSGDERLGAPSGAQMMQSLARRVFEQAPAHGPTVRGKVPPVWMVPPLTGLDDAAAQAPRSQPVTRNDRPGKRAEASTFGAANGAMLPVSSTPPPHSRARLALAAVGAVVVAAAVTFGITYGLRSPETDGAAAAAAVDDAAITSGPADAGPIVIVDAYVEPVAAVADAAIVDASADLAPDATATVTPSRATKPTAAKPGRSLSPAEKPANTKSFDPDDAAE
jgi:serine/threonine-protein kinase